MSAGTSCVAVECHHCGESAALEDVRRFDGCDRPAYPCLLCPACWKSATTPQCDICGAYDGIDRCDCRRPVARALRIAREMLRTMFLPAQRAPRQRTTDILPQPREAAPKRPRPIQKLPFLNTTDTGRTSNK